MRLGPPRNTELRDGRKWCRRITFRATRTLHTHASAVKRTTAPLLGLGKRRPGVPRIASVRRPVSGWLVDDTHAWGLVVEDELTTLETGSAAFVDCLGSRTPQRRRLDPQLGSSKDLAPPVGPEVL